MTPADGFERRGRYWYRVGGSHGHPYEWKTCERCGELRLIQHRSKSLGWGRFCSRSCAASSQVGTNAARWGGDAVGYTSLHKRVYRERGKATECVWGCQAPCYEWANLTGDYPDVWDYAPMCKPCHKRFDGAAGMMREDKDQRQWRIRYAIVRALTP